MKKVLNNISLNLFILLIVFSAFLIKGCNSGDPQSGELSFPKTRSKIEKHLKETKTPSISVAVAKDGEIIWEESFGLADVEKNIQATPHTMYHLGSLGKVYTATAIMILKERGLIDLDTQANEYLGETKVRAIEGDATDVTIRRILNHTSGLPNFWVHLYEDELAQRPAWDEVISQYGIVVSPPADRFIYSNLGFGILGYIIERISGQPYHEFMKNEVFEPLSLNRTHIDTGPYDEEYMAQKYTPEGKVPYSDHICKGGGTHFASAHDLVRFGMFHIKNHLNDQKPILSDKSIEYMQNAPSAKSSYRIGWQVYNKFGYRIVRHGGHVMGALASLRLIPSENIAVAVLSNGEGANTPIICEWIFAELLLRYNLLSTTKNIFSRGSSRDAKKFNSHGSFVGTWKGNITTYEDTIPVQLLIEANGDVWMKYLHDIGAEEKGVAPVENSVTQFSSNLFTANFPLQIPTTFTNRYRHTVYLNLKIRGDSLSGFISAEAMEPQMPHFSVPSYMYLEKGKDQGN